MEAVPIIIAVVAGLVALVAMLVPIIGIIFFPFNSGSRAPNNRSNLLTENNYGDSPQSAINPLRSPSPNYRLTGTTTVNDVKEVMSGKNRATRVATMRIDPNPANLFEVVNASTARKDRKGRKDRKSRKARRT